MKNYDEKASKAPNRKVQEILDKAKQMVLGNSDLALLSFVDYGLGVQTVDNFVGSTSFMGTHDVNGIDIYLFSRRLGHGSIIYATTDKFDGWMASLEDIKNYPHIEITMHELIMAA